MPCWRAWSWASPWAAPRRRPASTTTSVPARPAPCRSVPPRLLVRRATNATLLPTGAALVGIVGAGAAGGGGGATTAPSAAATTAATTAASAAAPSTAAMYTIGYSNGGGVGNGFREEQVCTAKAEALASKRVSTLTTIHRNTDAAGQLQDIRDLIAKGVQAIVFNPNSPDALNPALAEAK